jgi:predicted nucleic acid-binding protein
MNRAVFVDTSCWIGFFMPRDQHHEAAVAALEDLAQAGRSLLTSDLVVAETVTYLRIRGTARTAGRAWDALERGDVVRILETGRSHRAKAREIFGKLETPRLSVADCVSFALMAELGLREAVTFDEDYCKAGFVLLPGR